MLRGSNSESIFSPTFTRIFCTEDIDSPLRLASSTVVMPSNISIVLSGKDLAALFNLGGTYGASTGGWVEVGLFLNFPFLGVFKPIGSSLLLLASSSGLAWKYLRKTQNHIIWTTVYYSDLTLMAKNAI